MEFDHSPRAQENLALVSRFIQERVLPNEAVYESQLAHSSDFGSGASRRSSSS